MTDDGTPPPIPLRRRWPSPDREWTLVVLTVLAAALSALSVWQATTYAEQANDLQNQERIAADRQTEELAAFTIKVDHDLRLMIPYCAALTERGWALLDTFDDAAGSGPAAARANLPDASRRATLISSLFLLAYPPDCGVGAADGLIPTARERQAAADFEIGAADPAALAARAATAGQRESVLMAAGVAFAAALFLLTLADAAQLRRRRSAAPSPGPSSWATAWLLGSIVVLAVGAVAVVTRLELGAGEFAWVGAVLLVGAIVSVPAAARALQKAVRPVATSRPVRRVRWWRGRPLGWWAEIIGAAALVMFAATALGLTVSSLLERDAKAAADRLAVVAERVMEQSEQTAMRDLAMVAELVGLDVAEVGLPDVVAGQVRDLEGRARADLRDVLDADGTDDCAAWRDQATLAPDPEALLAAAESRSSAFSDHITRSLEPGVACATLAAVVRDQATHWGAQRSLFTVALVVLGLASFLVGSAGDADRSGRTAGWLMRIAIVGVSLGVVVSAMAALSFLGRGDLAVRPEQDPNLRAFARELAAGRTDLRIGACDEARGHLKAATDRYDGYPTAYLDRASGLACHAPGPVASSDIEDLDTYLDLLEAARGAGLDDRRVLAGLGWGHFLRGVKEGGTTEDLEVALAFSRNALDEIEASRQAGREPVPMAHVIRFNEAVTRLAIGQDATTAYRRAIDCLTGAVVCPGGPISDPALRSVLLLGALADLELIPGSVASTDDVRASLIAQYLGSPPAEKPDALAELKVDVFPQEVQVSAMAGDTGHVSIVWYYRRAATDPWTVLLDPSLRTLDPGVHLATPVRADAVLPQGSYRADVYRAGALVGRGSGAGVARSVASRRVVPDLGLSVVLPADWRRSAGFSLYEEKAAFGPGDDDPKLFLRRLEGAEVPDVASLDTQVDEWVGSLFPNPGDLDGAHDLPDAYHLGLSPAVVREYPGIGWRVVAGFSSYAASDQCPGTLHLALFIPDAIGLETYQSIVLAQDPVRIPTLARDYRSDAYGFSLRIPDGWDAFESPSGRRRTSSQFVARDCASRANVIVGSEPAQGVTLDGFVDGNYEVLRGFEGFQLLGRESMTLPSGLPAVRITYTWKAPQDVHQVQVYAISGSTGYFATITTALADVEAMRSTVAGIIDSLDIEAPTGSTGSP